MARPADAELIVSSHLAAPDASPTGLPARAVRLVREARWILLCFAGLFLLVVLLSHDPHDPGWSQAVATRQTMNMGGRVGAWIADLMLYVFGGSAYLFVAFLFARVVSGYRDLHAPAAQRMALPGEPEPRLPGSRRARAARNEAELAAAQSRRFAWERWLGFGLLLVASCALETARLYGHGEQLPLGPGGLIGSIVAAPVHELLGRIGGTFALLLSMAVGFSFATGLSWFSLFERTGRLLEDAALAVQARLHGVTGRRAAPAVLAGADAAAAGMARTGRRTAPGRRGDGAGDAPDDATHDGAGDADASWVGPADGPTPARGDGSRRAGPRSGGLQGGGMQGGGLQGGGLQGAGPQGAGPRGPGGRDAVSRDGVDDDGPGAARRAGGASDADGRDAVGRDFDDGFDDGFEDRAFDDDAAGDGSGGDGSGPRARPGPDGTGVPRGGAARAAGAASEGVAAGAAAGVVAAAAAASAGTPAPGAAWRDAAAQRRDAAAARAAVLSAATAPAAPVRHADVDRFPMPDLALLDPPAANVETVSGETLELTSRLIEKKLKDFGVSAAVVDAYPGPVITRYEVEPATGVKGSQIVNLSKDLARALSLVSLRVVETIPGKNLMGLELPNPRRQTVRLSEILGSTIYANSASPLTLALGKDIAGVPVVADLARMPHLLVAGTTGSGKSVGINAMILSLLYKAAPDQVRLILIDPKMLEMSVYEGIAHLLAPVVTDMRQAGNALNWCVAEMERRYRVMSKLGVRNLAGYNTKIADAAAREQPIPNPFSLTPDAPEPLQALPNIVVVIDELADLMMVVGKKIEELIARLAQKARAAGIHLILATQRPSVDVITGLIKANIPTRIAFQVSSKIDSRTILDQMGAESLLGQGDMLYQPPGTSVPQRVHGAYVADDEVHKVVEAWKQIAGEPDYVEGILEGGVPEDADTGSAIGFGGLSQTLSEAGADGETDAMYDQAVAVVLQHRRASISLVQRHLRIGYNRAARLLEQMEKSGLVSNMATNGNREILVPVSASAAD